MKIPARRPVVAIPDELAEAAPPAAPVLDANVDRLERPSVPRTSGPTSARSARDVVTQFYAAFERKDVDAMEKLYAPDVKFQDAIFSFGDRDGVTHMWRKLFEADPNAKLRFTLDAADGPNVRGHWVADYHVNGRPVHNEVSTTMKIVDGKITEHHDDFSWKKWAPQAFPGGALFTLPGLDHVAKALVRAVLG
ncbi:nuclear transport factor 2 family protein [Myxococcota bacterium]|nr:nuclear transport factor 2 family protein [Myxococcota bacterium]